MRLVDLIRGNHEAIITNWKDFARTLDLEEQFTDLAFRDHASEILDAIAYGYGNALRATVNEI